MPPSLIMLLGVLADRVFGEPLFLHPLVGFGRIAAFVEEKMNIEGAGRLRGTLALFLLVVPIVLVAFFLARIPAWGEAFSCLMLYFALGARSLAEHAKAVSDALAAGKIAEARRAVSKIVSRETEEMDESGVARAAVESVLENGGDAIFSTLFWFVLLGGPGAVLHRLANTLDAMWGYKTLRFLHFGWAAARLDDLLNWIPARLTVLTYAIFGKTRQALTSAFSERWESPNAGPVMAAGAGSLGLELGGPARYHGIVESRPIIGSGREPKPQDIARALALVQKGVLFWLLLASIGDYLA